MCFKQLYDLMRFALLERSPCCQCQKWIRESQTGSQENNWGSLSVDQSRVDNLCQLVIVGMNIISGNDIRGAKLI